MKPRSRRWEIVAGADEVPDLPTEQRRADRTARDGADGVHQCRAENPPIITLPMPDGTLARFSFEESPIIEPGLAAKYPELKTYRAQGIDDPDGDAALRLVADGLSRDGPVAVRHGADRSLRERRYRTNYITYWKRDAANTAESFECHFIDDPAVARVVRVATLPCPT